MGEISDALRRARSQVPPVEQPAPEPEKAQRARADDHVAALRVEAPAARNLPAARSATLSADRHGAWLARTMVVDERGAAAESFRHIALRIRRALENRGARGVAVVSALRSEGKTTIACNLALALASLARGRNVALVDFDLRKPSVARCLELPAGPGIDDVLQGTHRLEESCIAIDRPALDVFPARRPTANAHEILAQAALEGTVRELERRYEVVVFDTPPVLLVPDACVVVEHLGAAVAVARAGETARKGFEHMIELLGPDKLLGSILNDGSLPAGSHHYGYYGAPPGNGDST